MNMMKPIAFVACVAGMIAASRSHAGIVVDTAEDFRAELPRDFWFPQNPNDGSRTVGYQGVHWFVAFTFHPRGAFGYTDARPFSLWLEHTVPPHGEGPNLIRNPGTILFAVPAGDPFDPPFSTTVGYPVAHGSHIDDWTLYFDHSPGSRTSATVVVHHTPSPGTVALLGFGALLASRRRRR